MVYGKSTNEGIAKVQALALRVVAEKIENDISEPPEKVENISFAFV
jgi:hypothetical protein